MIDRIYNQKIQSILDLIKGIEELNPSPREREGSVPTLRRVETELQDLYIGIEWVRKQEVKEKKK